jgi:hypothetical protein
MRLLIALVLLCTLPALLQAQKATSSSLSSQLKKILSEASTDFKSLRGEQVKESSCDIIYASTMTLQGTSNNQVMDFESGKSYLARLGATTSSSEAQALLDAWKKKVVAIVGNSYEVMKDDHRTEESKQMGYLLLSEKMSISIHAIQYKGEDTINDFLLIMRL